MFVWQIPHFLAIATFQKDEYARAGIVVTPTVRGIAQTRHHIAAWTVVLIATTLLPMPLGIAGGLYTVIAAASGIYVMGLALAGYRVPVDGDTVNRWARKVFLTSILHLTLLFGALTLDHLLGL
jgi:protoheme IX farnesyltransferase